MAINLTGQYKVSYQLTYHTIVHPSTMQDPRYDEHFFSKLLINEELYKMQTSLDAVMNQQKFTAVEHVIKGNRKGSIVDIHTTNSCS